MNHNGKWNELPKEINDQIDLVLRKLQGELMGLAEISLQPYQTPEAKRRIKEITFTAIESVRKIISEVVVTK